MSFPSERHGPPTCQVWALHIAARSRYTVRGFLLISCIRRNTMPKSGDKKKGTDKNQPSKSTKEKQKAKKEKQKKKEGG